MTWVSWQSAWHHALYGDRGFYRSASGPGGHFSTSAVGIPGGTELLARAVVHLAYEHGLERIVDFACGSGELAARLASLAPDLEIVAVDIVERPNELPESVEWVRGDGGGAVPTSLGVRATLVLAHEWLDVVPCPVLAHDGRALRVVQVDDVGKERWGAPVDPADLSWCQAHWPGWDRPGTRVEVGRTRETAYARLRATITDGLLVTVDYGHLRDGRPHNGTLMGYRDGAACAPLPDGSTDITAHVAMDTLGVEQLVRQRDLFDRLALLPDRPHVDLARADPPAYLRALTAVGAYSALTSLGGLGDFWWALDPVSSRPDGR